MLKLLFTSYILFLFIIPATGQEPANTDSLAKATLVGYYTQSLQQQHLYNGIQHTGYSRSIKGHAYYLTTEWQTGSVVYDGIYYKDIPVLYDLYKDQVIIRPGDSVSVIGLVSPKVSLFTMGERRFKRVETDSLTGNMQPGFYEVLAEGSLTAVARRTKTLREFVTTKMEYEFLEQNRYFIKKDGTYHIVRSEDQLLDLLGVQRTEIKQYLRKNRIRFKKNPGQSITKAVEYYESLKK